jgi:hypothetical protein
MILIERALYEGYIDKDYPSNSFKALIKYYVLNGLDKDKILIAMDLFMKKNYKEYVYNKWKDRIKNWVNKEFKNPTGINNVKKVYITNRELNIISSIDDKELEKVAFVYLVHSKIYNQLNEKCDYWVKSKMSDILKDAKVKKARTVREQEAMNRQLCDLGLLQFSHKVDLTNNRVNFAHEDDEIVIEITDFREFVLNYLKWKGENIKNCESCNVLIKIIGNRTKFCNECYKIKNQKEASKRMQKHRQNKDVTF